MIIEGYALYYLMRTINIVDTMPEVVRGEVSERIEMILENIEGYIPSLQDIKKVTDKLQRLGKSSKEFARLLRLKNGDLSLDDLGKRVIIEKLLSSSLVYEIVGKLADVE